MMSEKYLDYDKHKFNPSCLFDVAVGRGDEQQQCTGILPAAARVEKCVIPFSTAGELDCN